MDFLTIFMFVVYFGIILVSFHYFKKWIREFSGKQELTNPIWFVTFLAAAAVPATIINTLIGLLQVVGWILLLF